MLLNFSLGSSAVFSRETLPLLLNSDASRAVQLDGTTLLAC